MSAGRARSESALVVALVAAGAIGDSGARRHATSPTGLRYTNKRIEALPVQRHDFHGE